jgi:hypothetical protein
VNAFELQLDTVGVLPNAFPSMNGKMGMDNCPLETWKCAWKFRQGIPDINYFVVPLV